MRTHHDAVNAGHASFLEGAHVEVEDLLMPPVEEIIMEVKNEGCRTCSAPCSCGVLGASGVEDCGCCRSLFVGRVGVGVPGGLLVTDPGSSVNCSKVLVFEYIKVNFPTSFQRHQCSLCFHHLVRAPHLEIRQWRLSLPFLDAYGHLLCVVGTWGIFITLRFEDEAVKITVMIHRGC